MLVAVEAELSRFKPVEVVGLPRFTGGAVGYLGYEVVRYFEERVPKGDVDALHMPESVFMFTDTLLVFDHLRHKIQVVSHLRLDGDIEAAYRQAAWRIEELVGRLEKPLAQLPYRAGAGRANEEVVTSNMTPQEHAAIVDKAKEHIVAGDYSVRARARRQSRQVDMQIGGKFPHRRLGPRTGAVG